MRYVAAYLLAVLGGKAAPAAGDLEKILSSVGIEADSEKLKKVLGDLKGKNIEEVIAQGRKVYSFLVVIKAFIMNINLGPSAIGFYFIYFC